MNMPLIRIVSVGLVGALTKPGPQYRLLMVKMIGFPEAANERLYRD